MNGQLHATATISQDKSSPYPLVTDWVCSSAGLGAGVITTVPRMPIHCTDYYTPLRRECVATLKFCSFIKDLIYIDMNNLCFTVAFMVDEEDHEFDGTPSLSHEKSDDSLCGIHSFCTPIKSCTLLQDLMEQSCLATEK